MNNIKTAESFPEKNIIMLMYLHNIKNNIGVSWKWDISPRIYKTYIIPPKNPTDLSGSVKSHMRKNKKLKATVIYREKHTLDIVKL